MAWERFEGGKVGRKSLHPTLSILKVQRGRPNSEPMFRLTFNKNAAETFSLKNYKACDLYFDPGTKRIGIRPDNSGINKISHGKRNPPIIHATLFIKQYNIEPKNSIPLKIENNMIVTEQL